MRAYERLLKYVTIHTTSDFDSGAHPSYEGEFDLARVLEKELKELGMQDVCVDDRCYVYAYLPASTGCENKRAIGFIAHMDTAPDAPGENVRPILHENYQGGKLVLGDSGLVLDPDKFAFLEKFIGETVITSDGTTLLGADDKAGVAEIMTALEILTGHGEQEHSAMLDAELQSVAAGTAERKHPAIYVAFTPDEEIGEGTEFFDMERFKARFAYTVDGGDIDCLEYENFNAASAEITIHGVSIHPGDAKDTMINAARVAMEFDTMLPATERPEHTEGREGFYHLTDLSGNVSEAHLSYIIRDHDREIFENRKKVILETAEKLNKKYGEGTVDITVRDSYYNMIEKIRPYPELIENAKAAIESVGLIPQEIPIRGGTDGARLSYMGIPCPNLGTGGFNFHGKYECITAERMDRAVQILTKLME